MKVSRSELIHLQLQAIIRDNNVPNSELLYLGERDEEHWYLIDGKHEVPSSLIDDVTETTEE